MSEKFKGYGCWYPFLPCLFNPSPEELLSKQRSDEIDRQIRQDKKIRKAIRLLLLGAGESGKSTIIKQMQLIHVQKFSEAECQKKRQDIRNNLLEAILSIAEAAKTLEPAVALEHPDNSCRLNWILEHCRNIDFDFPPEFFEHVSYLWQDKGILAIYERSSEYQLIDNAQYFLDKTEDISKEDYLPTEQDILRCRVRTSGIHDIILNFLSMADVGGQRGERRKWFLCFNDVTGIIFVTATSSYNLVLREDSTQNRIQESLNIFKIVWRNRYFRRISVILFLNKQDIFTEKILAGKHKIADYFPEYNQFQIPAEASKDSSQHPEVVRGKYFIKSLFQNICSENGESYYHRCFYHFTCAVDTENIKRVFDDCRNMIQMYYLLEADLM